MHAEFSRMASRACLRMRSRCQSTALILHLCLIALLYPTAGNPARPEATPLRICTAIAPLAYCIEQIGGTLVTVDTLLPEGQDPHMFEPGPRLLHRLSNAQLYLMAGLPFERILVDKIRAQHTKIRIIDTGKHIDLLSADHEQVCSGDHGADHDHTGHDPHFWLGTRQLRQFIELAQRVITEADPDNAAAYAQNTTRLLAALEAAHAGNLRLLQPHRNRTFFVYHPAFGYFAHTYTLNQQTVEINGRQPTARHISALIKQARSSGVRTIFVQPQFDTKTAQTIAAQINGTVVPLDPLAKDVIRNLQTMANAIAGAFDQTIPNDPAHTKAGHGHTP
ncbi:MAG: ABC transporter substrate-binding protein [Deltaproteobacteria bacterium]|nr:ABC transporter substrate-binding protein [Deltaproteobacteria bacterium]